MQEIKRTGTYEIAEPCGFKNMLAFFALVGIGVALLVWRWHHPFGSMPVIEPGYIPSGPTTIHGTTFMSAWRFDNVAIFSRAPSLDRFNSWWFNHPLFGVSPASYTYDGRKYK